MNTSAHFLRLRGRSIVGPLLLYLLMAGAMMSPFASKRLVQSTASDLEAHLSGIVEARSALLGGQFPIRVAPTENDNLRYPIFQFYGNFPYTAGAVLSLMPGINPYTAWKLVHLLGLTLAGFFTYRSALTLTGRRDPSVIAGAAFVFAPYLWTDIHARFAYTETISFLLLPAVMYFSLRAFVTRRWAPIFAAGICWNLVALSHNITYLYASAFFGLFFASMMQPTRRSLGRLSRVGLGYMLGVVLSLWYVVPQLTVLKMVNVGEASSEPFATRVFSDFASLTSPWLRVPAAAADTTARFGPQVGWPILAGLVGCVVMLCVSRWARGRRWMIGRAMICFAIAFYMVWSPAWSNDARSMWGNFWLVLPQVFWYVQFTYRILVIVVLFGSLLLAYALAAAFPRGMRAKSLLTCLFLIGLAASSYYPRHPKMAKSDLARLMAHPEMGEGGAGLLYLVSAKSAMERSMYHPDANIAAGAFGTLGQGWLRKPGVLTITTPRDVSAIVFEGEVPKEFGSPVTLTTAFNDWAVGTSTLAPGRFRLRVPFTLSSPDDKPTTTLKLSTDRWIKPRAVEPAAVGEDDISIHFDSITFESAGPKPPPLIGYEQVRSRIARRSASTFIVTTNQPSVVQLPVLCYPGLMRVFDNSESIAYKNLGRLIAVNLPAGPHVLSVQFAGVAWANGASAAGWLMVLAGFGIGAALHFKRKRVSIGVGGTAMPVRKVSSRFPPRAAVGGFALVVLGLSFSNVGAIVKELGRPARLSVTASSSESEYSKPKCAFDDDPTTAWVAKGSDPASMTIRLSKSGSISGIIFESRQTALIEAWQKIHVRLLSGERPVHEQDYSLPQQRTTPTVQIDLPSTPMDRIELNFSDPVLTTRDGTKTFNAGQVNPGYREIRLLWAK